MLDYSIGNFFFTVDGSYFHRKNFILGAEFADFEDTFLLQDSVDSSNKEVIQYRETSFSISLGLISFHIGYRKETVYDE